jgi:hypothetical protein
MTAPLAGLRVVELAGVGPSRHGGLLLAQLGVDVVLVSRPTESPRRADSVMAPRFSAAEPPIPPPPPAQVSVEVILDAWRLKPVGNL